MKFKVWKECREHFLRHTLSCLVLSTRNYWLTRGGADLGDYQHAKWVMVSSQPIKLQMTWWCYTSWGPLSCVCCCYLFIFEAQLSTADQGSKPLGTNILDPCPRRNKERYLVIWGRGIRCTEKMSQGNYYYNHIFIISVIIIDIKTY